MRYYSCYRASGPGRPAQQPLPHDRTSRGAQVGEDEEGAGDWD
jgi:hypothetical protein